MQRPLCWVISFFSITCKQRIITATDVDKLDEVVAGEVKISLVDFVDGDL